MIKKYTEGLIERFQYPNDPSYDIEKEYEKCMVNIDQIQKDLKKSEKEDHPIVVFAGCGCGMDISMHSDLIKACLNDLHIPILICEPKADLRHDLRDLSELHVDLSLDHEIFIKELDKMELPMVYDEYQYRLRLREWEWELYTWEEKTLKTYTRKTKNWKSPKNYFTKPFNRKTMKG